MALGFQRIHDVSPLSLKLLNDQLDTLWKKMMGGLEVRDMTSGTAARINAAVSRDEAESLIAQSADGIRVEVVTKVEARELVAAGTEAAKDAARGMVDASAEAVRDAARGMVDASAGAVRDAAQGMVDASAEAVRNDARGMVDASAEEVRDEAKELIDAGTARAKEEAIVVARGLIEASAEQIRLEVSSMAPEVPVAGDNLLRNSGAEFGVESWEAVGCGLSAGEDLALGWAFAVDRAGTIAQAKIALKAETKYTLRFVFLCPAGVRAEIPELSLVGEQVAGAVHTDYKLEIQTQEAREITVRLAFAGAGSVGRMMLCEGDGVVWKQNPNEVKNSSITLTDERVAIDTGNFELRLYNEEGAMVTEMSANAQGFSNLVVAENIQLRGRPMYLGEGLYYLWVRPDAPKVGERRFFTTSSAPLTMEGCFPDVQEAIDFIPKWCDGEVVVAIQGAGAWQYPTSKIAIANFYGGGSVSLVLWGSGNYMLKQVDVRNNALEIVISSAVINSCGPGDVFRVRNSSCWLRQCKVNGRGKLSQEAGFDASYGAVMVLSACEAHQCRYGARAHSGGRIYVEDGAGSGNTTGLAAHTGGIIQVARSTFQATTVSNEMDGGKILTPVSTTRPGTLPPATLEELSVKYPLLTTCSWKMKEGGGGVTGTWQTSPDWLRVGNGDQGMLWVDTTALKTRLRDGQTIVYAALTLRRRGEGGTSRAATVSLRGIMNKAPTGALLPVTNFGPIGSWRWGEKKTVSVPVAAITAMVKGMAYGYTLIGDDEAVFEGASGSPLLEVIFRDP